MGAVKRAFGPYEVERELARGWRAALAKAEGEPVGANLRVTVAENLARLTEVRPLGPGVSLERSWIRPGPGS